MKTRTLSLLLAAAGLLSLSGCVTNQNRSAVQYDANSASQLQQLTYGRVLELRPVVIDLSSGNAYGPMAIGGLLGGALGNTAGKSGSSTNRIATVTGAALGAAAGEVTSKAMAKADGVEVTLQLEPDGRRVALVQEADIALHVGQCVKVSAASRCFLAGGLPFRMDVPRLSISRSSRLTSDR